MSDVMHASEEFVLKALEAKQDALSKDQLDKISNALTDASRFDKAGDAAKVKEELLIEIGKLGSLEIESVAVLPATGKSGVIYLVPSSKPGDKNLKDEYLWINGAWELIGSTAVDLSGYAKTEDVNRSLSEKQDALTHAQLANIDDVPQKRDKSDMFTEWSIVEGGEYCPNPSIKSEGEGIIRYVLYSNGVVVGEAYGSDEELMLEFTGTDILGRVTATRQRILTTDDVTTNLTNPLAGKTAAAAAVKTALEGKLNKRGVSGAEYDFDNVGSSPSMTSVHGFGTMFIDNTEGAVVSSSLYPDGSDVTTDKKLADATKLTPVKNDGIIVGYKTANGEYVSAQTADDITSVAEAAIENKVTATNPDFVAAVEACFENGDEMEFGGAE